MAKNYSEEEVESLQSQRKTNLNKFTVIENENPTRRKKVQKILDSNLLHRIIVILVIIDCLAVASELGIVELQKRLKHEPANPCGITSTHKNLVDSLETNKSIHKHHTEEKSLEIAQGNNAEESHGNSHEQPEEMTQEQESHEEGPIHLILEVLENIMKFTSLIILGIFVVEIVVKLVVHPTLIFKSAWETIDTVIVVVSFSVNVYLTFKEDAFKNAHMLLVLLRLWRIGEIVNGVVVALEEKHEIKIEKLRNKIEFLEEQVQDLSKNQREKTSD